MANQNDYFVGRRPGLAVITRTGINIDFDTGGSEDIYGGAGAYAGFATAAEICTVASGSANDTAAGTGARTVLITGLDSNYLPQSETVTLNGTSTVDTVNSYIRINHLVVATAGSGGVNAGIITVAQKVTTANILLTVPVGFNKETTSAYCVPAGKTAYLVKLFGQVRKGTSSYVDCSVLVKTQTAPLQLNHPFSVGPTSVYQREFLEGIRIPEKSDVLIRGAVASADNAEVVAGYELVLINN